MIWYFYTLENNGHSKSSTIYHHIKLLLTIFPCGSDGNKSACNAGDPGSIPGLGRSLGEGNGNPL